MHWFENKFREEIRNLRSCKHLDFCLESKFNYCNKEWAKNRAETGGDRTACSLLTVNICGMNGKFISSLL